MPPANLIDGRIVARQLQDELAQRIATLTSCGVQPGLAFVRVGEDPASKVYVGRKEKTCADLGIYSETHVLPEAAMQWRTKQFMHSWSKSLFSEDLSHAKHRAMAALSAAVFMVNVCSQ